VNFSRSAAKNSVSAHFRRVLNCNADLTLSPSPNYNYIPHTLTLTYVSIRAVPIWLSTLRLIQCLDLLFIGSQS